MQISIALEPRFLDADSAFFVNPGDMAVLRFILNGTCKTEVGDDGSNRWVELASAEL
jgi:hypothetical protein